jgi:hypothetical protein
MVRYDPLPSARFEGAADGEWLVFMFIRSPHFSCSLSARFAGFCNFCEVASQAPHLHAMNPFAVSLAYIHIHQSILHTAWMWQANGWGPGGRWANCLSPPPFSKIFWEVLWWKTSDSLVLAPLGDSICWEKAPTAWEIRRSSISETITERVTVTQSFEQGGVSALTVLSTLFLPIYLLDYLLRTTSTKDLITKTGIHQQHQPTRSGNDAIMMAPS